MSAVPPPCPARRRLLLPAALLSVGFAAGSALLQAEPQSVAHGPVTPVVPAAGLALQVPAVVARTAPSAPEASALPAPLAALVARYPGDGDLGPVLVSEVAAWARREPSAAQRWVDGIDPNQASLLCDALYGLAVGLPAAQMRAFAGRPREQLGWMALEVTAQTAPASELADTAAWLATLNQQGQSTRRAAQALARRYAAQFPEQALNWALHQLPWGEVRQGTLPLVVEGAAAADPAGTLSSLPAVLAELPAGDDANLLADRLMQAWWRGARKRPGAVDEARRLPLQEPLRAALLRLVPVQ